MMRISLSATNQGEPCVGDSSLAGQAYMNICRRVMGEEVPFLDLKVKTSFFDRLKNLFKIGGIVYGIHGFLSKEEVPGK